MAKLVVLNLDECMKPRLGKSIQKLMSICTEKICKAGDEEKAIQIAQQKLEQCIREGKTKPSEMFPCTTMYELVGEIKKYEFNYFVWYELIS